MLFRSTEDYTAGLRCSVLKSWSNSDRQRSDALLTRTVSRASQHLSISSFHCLSTATTIHLQPTTNPPHPNPAPPHTPPTLENKDPESGGARRQRSQSSSDIGARRKNRGPIKHRTRGRGVALQPDNKDAGDKHSGCGIKVSEAWRAQAGPACPHPGGEGVGLMRR